MAHADLDELLSFLLPFAQDQLAKHGEFFRFGATMATDGNVQLAMASAEDEEDADLPPEECLATLADGFRQESAAGRLRATALCWDSRVTVEAEVTDAISMGLEHVEGESIDACLPCRNEPGGIEFGDLMVCESEPQIFS